MTTERAAQQLPSSPQGGCSSRLRLTLGLGRVLIAEVPSIVRTVLGSCVAVILHVPRLRLSALCHAQMPERREDPSFLDDASDCGCEDPDDEDLKYVSCSIRYMLDELGRRGVTRQEIVATLVDGGNVVRNIDRRWSVGSRNVQIARLALAKEGIPISYMDIGGTRGRVVEHVSDRNHTRVRYHEGA